jgi:hypothetical protein
MDRLARITKELLSVPDAETTFEIDEYNDLYAKNKPTLCIKMRDIFAIHNLVFTTLSWPICPSFAPTTMTCSEKSPRILVVRRTTIARRPPRVPLTSRTGVTSFFYSSLSLCPNPYFLLSNSHSLSVFRFSNNKTRIRQKFVAAHGNQEVHFVTLFVSIWRQPLGDNRQAYHAGR